MELGPAVVLPDRRFLLSLFVGGNNLKTNKNFGFEKGIKFRMQSMMIGAKVLNLTKKTPKFASLKKNKHC